MQERIDLIIAQTINKLGRELSDTRNRAFLKQDLEKIFNQYFIEALEEAEDDLMQAVLWKNLSLKFHPDKLKNENFKFTHYLTEQDLTGQDSTCIPQQVLNSLNSLKIKRPPKFLENPNGWIEFFAELIVEIEGSEEGSIGRKKLETQLRRQSFIVNGLYSLWRPGLDNYFQPVRFIFKAIFFLGFISSVLAVFLLFISVNLINSILSVPKRFINFLISIATSDEFSRQLELYKTSYKEEKLEEIKKHLSEDAPQSNDEIRRIHVMTLTLLLDTFTTEDILNNQFNQELESNSFLYLKLILLGFYHSLFKDISNESLGTQVLFVISWPFRLIADIILFILMGVIELTRNAVSVALLLLPLAVGVIANTTLLFLLNLPRYVLVEIPRGIINYFQPSNNVSTEEDNSKGPPLLIDCNNNETKNTQNGDIPVTEKEIRDKKRVSIPAACHKKILDCIADTSSPQKEKGKTIDIPIRPQDAKFGI